MTYAVHLPDAWEHTLTDGELVEFRNSEFHDDANIILNRWVIGTDAAAREAVLSSGVSLLQDTDLTARLVSREIGEPKPSGVQQGTQFVEISNGARVVQVYLFLADVVSAMQLYCRPEVYDAAIVDFQKMVSSYELQED